MSRLYDLVNSLWQNLQMNCFLGRGTGGGGVGTCRGGGSGWGCVKPDNRWRVKYDSRAWRPNAWAWGDSGGRRAACCSEDTTAVCRPSAKETSNSCCCWTDSDGCRPAGVSSSEGPVIVEGSWDTGLGHYPHSGQSPLLYHRSIPRSDGRESPTPQIFSSLFSVLLLRLSRIVPLKIKKKSRRSGGREQPSSYEKTTR